MRNIGSIEHVREQELLDELFLAMKARIVLGALNALDQFVD
jgi:hypothetical protein